MIIGDYVVNPLEVVYGKREWIPSGPMYIISIQIRTEVGIIPLVQYSPSDKESKKMMKLIEDCIKERKEAILSGIFDDDGWEEGDAQ